MKINISKSRKTSDNIIVLPFFQRSESVENQDLLSKEELAFVQRNLHHFQGELGETIQCTSDQDVLFIILGLGKKEKWSTEQCRRAYSGITTALKKIKTSSATITFPNEDKKYIKAAVEGVVLSAYNFKITEKTQNLIESLNFISNETQLIENTQKMCHVIYFVRDIINLDPSSCTPATLEEASRDIAKSENMNITVWDSKKLQEEGMGGIYNVGRGSSIPPRLIKLEYKNNPKNSKPYTFVGKGVTFDSGGYNIKPTGYMEDMKCDMGGAATVLGLMKLLAIFQPNVHVIGYVPTVENLVDGAAYKPGDILTMRNKKTVEVLNTDAEGRLILADTLVLACEEKPEYIVDLATLTGAVIAALGHEYTGLVTNNQSAIKNILESFEEEDEKIWQMPLDDDFQSQTKGVISDIKNIAPKHVSAGTIMAGAFLREFVDETPWIHLDIAGTSYNEKSQYYNTYGATGTCVRSLWNLINR